MLQFEWQMNEEGAWVSVNGVSVSGNGWFSDWLPDRLAGWLRGVMLT